jgi:hypothetical protein
MPVFDRIIVVKAVWEAEVAVLYAADFLCEVGKGA